MSMLMTQPAQHTKAICLPEPRMPIAVRPGTMEDIPFIDSLQKKMNRQLGWMPRAQLEGKVKAGHVLVAQAPRLCSGGSKNEPDTGETPVPLGYIIGNDQYFKRDDLGCIFQLCVVEGQRRGLIGAALVKAMFDRAAYGCRLFCCWCAQDIEANHFWESLGFVPLAFRAGSRTKGKGGTPRVHIFWQKRIREGDNETPYWFPSKTSGGALGEDRLVIPIPPGTHWSEAKPLILPERDEPDLGGPASSRAVGASDATRQSASATLTRSPAATTLSRRERGQKKKPAPVGHPQRPPGVALGGLWFAPKTPPPPKEEAPTRQRKPARKHDPKYVAAARELRDRFLEAVQRDPQVLLPTGKYDVTRALPEPPDQRLVEPRLISSELKALPEAA